MVAAGAAIAVMVGTLVWYERRDAPSSPAVAGAPHVGAQHHTAAGGHMGAQLAPIQVFAQAKVGDWITYRVTNRSSMLAREIEAIVTARVTAATDTRVTVEYRGSVPAQPEKHEQWTREYPRQGLTVDQLSGNDVSGWTIYDLVITDDVREVAGRKLATKRLSWAAKDPLFPTKRVRDELWIAADVPVGGLVAERDVQDMDTFHDEQIKELIEFGTADSVTTR
jgi:hypothetical protein